MTNIAPSTRPMRRSKKIRTSCPKNSSPAQYQVEAKISADVPSSPEVRELEARFRAGGFNEMAAKYARRCKGNADDLLSAAMVHALRRPHWDLGVEKRIEDILSSHAYSINRTRKRMEIKGVKLVADNDGAMIERHRPSLLDPAAEIERERRRAGAIRVLDVIAGDDPQMRALIDGICQRQRGRMLCGMLKITERELATLRRRLKRTAQSTCGQLCVDGIIDPDMLQDFAA
ncbi:hypothetical protein [Erythrobacter oryzae]|uniref:hypothetical protein n=1 Tax=Erythrobacter oryzae TaxID=3019556 RepID=UPI002553E25F|nr:hypothetical protein [Erythrobacter sp. COR-2]